MYTHSELLSVSITTFAFSMKFLPQIKKDRNGIFWLKTVRPTWDTSGWRHTPLVGCALSHGYPWLTHSTIHISWNFKSLEYVVVSDTTLGFVALLISREIPREQRMGSPHLHYSACSWYFNT